ncbi:class III lanthionine synthetase LanKC N-terminal domain-containing protein [Pediococcus claussenii]|uniref:RamC N-terminal domain-containing protein n=1 Tax=Pediococcus claussenii (strain ATCC BAA-344 / DSM 14800 / JCM 18046 / KCTC 3811 / LMG 21948 / P06) TaxID=701521 RepID=G8PBA3_PEDCP|nr:hypothetical protein [Pediococcus claussenii]AEV95892.1 hypothetical protein PECL_1675 [Pediococcus claussenii ATCC BAA-344]ANZ69386.1 hypothetical protein AYR57_03280 [Pediococcus claussenii]ANZ71206.1 hypothetical protein AYR58_03295 [Pediococcus claussenii]
MYILPAKYNYVKKENENIFTYYFLINYEIPREGWKIHISSSLGDAQNIITIIANYCYANNISFKHVRDEALYLENISSEANSAESGKLITIYPQNEQHALKIMSDCTKLLSTMAGPNILSDYQFKNSKNVFFRYGLNYASKNRNPDTFNLISPKGEKQPDSVQPFPKLPKWIQLPQNWVLNVSDNDNILKYHPFAILKRNNGGKGR